MHSRFPRWAAITAATALSLVSALPQSSALAQAGPATGPACTFQLGFADFIQAVSSDVVGSCQENEHINKYNGNVEQLASNGLLYWRPCDNTTVFTDGSVTWLNGPSGIQNRLSAGVPFDWESITPCVSPTSAVNSAPAAPAATPAPAPAPTALPAPPPPALTPPPALPAAPVCTQPVVSIRNTDLSNADRRGVNYSCADAYHAKLAGADFSNANLAGATLESADLTRANFSGAHLSFARLVMATGTSSKLSPGPNFNGADLRGAKLSTAKLSYSDFRYADLSNTDLSRAILTGSDLRGTDLRGADLSQADFTDANLTGAYLCGATTTGTIFLRAVGVSTACN